MPNGSPKSTQPLDMINTSDLGLTKPDLWAMHYMQLRDAKEAAKLAGYSESYIKGQFFADKKNPDSALLRALRSYIETQDSFRQAAADGIVDDFLDVCSDIAKHVKQMPVDDKIKVMPKISNAMEFSRKAGSKGQEITHQTVNVTTYQLQLGQLVGKSVSRYHPDDEVIDVEVKE